LVWPVTLLRAEVDVTPANAAGYLETGEMSYTVNVNFSRVTWKSEEQFAKEIRKAEEDLARDPENLDLAADFIELCREAGRDDLAGETAEAYVDRFFQEYKRNQDEISARRLLIATNQIGPEEAYFTAYEAVRPFLEQGTASIETVFAALQNRELAGDQQLGYRIAEFYQQFYPENGELFFRGFLLTLTNSLQRTIPYMIGAIHSQMDDVDSYLQEYFQALESSVYLDILDRALELDPDNYQYLVASVGFRALVRWFSLLGTMMQEEDLQLDSLQDLFDVLNRDQDQRLGQDLQKALKLRPPEDIQIFLAAALFHATAGDARHAGEYVRKALRLRPDVPEVYDAQVFTVLLELAGQDEDPSLEQRNRIEEILLDKMEKTGKNAYDLYVLSVLQTLKIRDGVTERQRVQLLQQMKSYIDDSLTMEDSLLGRLSRGNLALLEDRTEDAVSIYESAFVLEPERLHYTLQANIGVAYFMQGDSEQGKKYIRQAGENFEGELHAAELLVE